MNWEKEFNDIGKDLIACNHSFTIKQDLFAKQNGRAEYNRIIRNQVKKQPGIYIWSNNANQEILYIGKAGTVKNDGSFGNHSLRERLVASRGKDPISRKDITTNDYLAKKMEEYNINEMKISVYYSKVEIPPAILEAKFLFNFYKVHKKLPLLNDSF